jgi:hypothetical protein
MTRYLPATDQTEMRMSLFRLAAGDQLGAGVHYSLQGPELVLEGRVPSYETKCRIEAAGRDAGFQIVNWLRIVPGAPPLPRPTPGLAPAIGNLTRKAS